MRRRFDGFVVGKQTVRQQRGWKIGRKTRQGRVHYFAPEAEIAEGLEIRPGLEVVFLTEMREERMYALNVQPKPAHMEESMRKLKLGLIAAIILAIVALVGVFKPYHSDPIRGWIVETRAQITLWSIKRLGVDDIIRDGVVRAAISQNRWGDLRGASWAAREEVFRVNQCQVFSIGYENPDETCDYALYYEGSNNPWVQERHGIPTNITSTFFPAARATIYRTVRTHLASPQNLRAMYLAKKGVIVDEFRRLSPEDQLNFLVQLSGGIRSFIQFQTDTGARLAREHLLAADEAWSAALERGREEERRVVHAAYYKAFEDLAAMVDDWQVFMFAGRRFGEGGDALIAMYIEVMKDLQATLRTIRTPFIQ
jgi:hypothetical protein